MLLVIALLLGLGRPIADTRDDLISRDVYELSDIKALTRKLSDSDILDLLTLHDLDLILDTREFDESQISFDVWSRKGSSREAGYWYRPRKAFTFMGSSQCALRGYYAKEPGARPRMDVPGVIEGHSQLQPTASFPLWPLMGA
ncbi:hypothetical protein D9611_008000 [Ephemerocybe angulata]|uniref:Uncharacterized protein n=1 Tax=Ephemerocybe angulata TaxID=980116 RepID=A0A8H5C024_9AGAR|nr:hypothetical protein D9611_008000 [Tulosesus angulatus]